ncbi:hypothetical protein HAX54_047697, partial [Datura stramonium]|nr:hypothetical protein [Datura stramonium]
FRNVFDAPAAGVAGFLLRIREVMVAFAKSSGSWSSRSQKSDCTPGAQSVVAMAPRIDIAPLPNIAPLLAARLVMTVEKHKRLIDFVKICPPRSDGDSSEMLTSFWPMVEEITIRLVDLAVLVILHPETKGYSSRGYHSQFSRPIQAALHESECGYFGHIIYSSGQVS